MVLKPGREDQARAIFEKWELDFAVIGTHHRDRPPGVSKDGAVAADIPVDPLVSEAPLRIRPAVGADPAARGHPRLRTSSAPESISDAADRQLHGHSPDLASRRWIWEQYDHHGRGETVIAAGRRRRRGARRTIPTAALAITTDCTPRYCLADPDEGGKQAVAEAYRNLMRRRRTAARRHQQPQFRQSGAAADHGSARRRRDRHGRGLPRARLPGRLGQCLALQRDQRQGDPAHARHRRRRPDSTTWRKATGIGLVGGDKRSW